MSEQRAAHTALRRRESPLFAIADGRCVRIRIARNELRLFLICLSVLTRRKRSPPFSKSDAAMHHRSQLVFTFWTSVYFTVENLVPLEQVEI
jgi:hypothetical protein